MSTKVIPPKELLEATVGGLSVFVVAGGADGDVLTQQSDGTYAPETPSAASGDVVGPASATDNEVVRFDSTTGKLVQAGSGVKISDAGELTGPSNVLPVKSGSSRQLLRVFKDATNYIEVGTNWSGTSYSGITGPADSPLVIDSPTSYGVYLAVQGTIHILASTAGTVVNARGPTVPAACFKAAASHTANVVEVQNNVGVVGAAIDKNCGAYFDWLGSSPGLFVDSTNHRVGVGTSAPSYKLHVVTSVSAGFKIQTTGGSIASPSLDFIDSTNGVEMVLTPNGANCAIGTYSNHPTQIIVNQVVVGNFDTNATAGETRFMLWDVDAGTLKRVSVGAADSGGTGFKVLRIPN